MSNNSAGVMYHDGGFEYLDEEEYRALLLALLMVRLKRLNKRTLIALNVFMSEVYGRESNSRKSQEDSKAS